MMMKWQTPVAEGKCPVPLRAGDEIMVLGSCFADETGRRLAECGLDVCVNPFGTLYNPVSVCNSISRLQCGVPFTREDCVGMGAGAGLVCSFSHHTSFARPTPEAFLEHANAALETASARWKSASKVLITLGTAWCWRHLPEGEIVSNCLKRPAGEFSRERLTVPQTAALLKSLVQRYPDKFFVFTVSPIRHLSDGAHGNQVSKSILLLAMEEVCAAFPDRTAYFPAYEILLDELRDYRFYAEDMVHPSLQAAEYVFGKFLSFAFPDEERSRLEERRRAFKASQHRPMH
ncbi:MAG: GSCFA domain-containing protein [Bacteroidales bacterium]|nr:GSCFA domain-containing protein [Bacteroidales bacterium]MBR1893769.1 GSCFA domain-containing protein [Bacteroidales bacterium]